MTNLFESGKLTIYGDSWRVSARRAFNDGEKNAVSKATVVNSEYGYSVCFMLKRGGKSYIPLSNTSSLGVGDEVDMNTAQLLTLSREGDNDIMRVDA